LAGAPSHGPPEWIEGTKINETLSFNIIAICKLWPLICYSGAQLRSTGQVPLNKAPFVLETFFHCAHRPLPV